MNSESFITITSSDIKLMQEALRDYSVEGIMIKNKNCLLRKLYSIQSSLNKFQNKELYIYKINRSKKMNDIKSRAQEYIAKHSEYSEEFGMTFVAVDTLTAMVEFSKQETKELEEKLKEHESVGNAQFWKNVWSWKTKAEHLSKAKELLQKCLNTYIKNPELKSEIVKFLKEE